MSENTVVTFSTWQAFVTAASGQSQLGTYERSSRDEHRNDWYGGVTWEQALDMARKGNAAQYDKLTKRAVKLERRIENEIPVQAVEYDVVGQWVDVGAYMTGEPECMGSVVNEPTPRPVVRIAVNVAVSAAISVEVIEARGAATLALVDALERSGRRCEVVICSAWTPSRQRTSTDVWEWQTTVKRPEERLNPGLLAYVLCHASVCRRLGFSLEECQPQDVRDKWGFISGSGYGVPTESTIASDIYLGKTLLGDVAWSDPASAETWVLNTLKSQGIVVS